MSNRLIVSWVCSEITSWNRSDGEQLFLKILGRFTLITDTEPEKNIVIVSAEAHYFKCAILQKKDRSCDSSMTLIIKMNKQIDMKAQL